MKGKIATSVATITALAFEGEARLAAIAPFVQHQPQQAQDVAVAATVTTVGKITLLVKAKMQPSEAVRRAVAEAISHYVQSKLRPSERLITNIVDGSIVFHLKLPSVLFDWLNANLSKSLCTLLSLQPHSLRLSSIKPNDEETQ